MQRELAITSGYRSPEVQQKLWDASDKTGHSVAAPGKRKHQHGTAADLAGFGLGGDDGVSPETKAWVRNNAGTYNLFFPMGHEPWHIQYSSDSTGAGPTAPTATPLSTVLADATGPTVEQTDKQRLYAGLAAGLGACTDTRDQAPEVLGDLTGAPQMIGLEAPRATPAPTAPPRAGAGRSERWPSCSRSLPSAALALRPDPPDKESLMPSLAEVLSAAYRPDDPSETPMVLPPGPMGWYQGPPHQGFEDWLRSRPDTAPSLPTAPRPDSEPVRTTRRDGTTDGRAPGWRAGAAADARAARRHPGAADRPSRPGRAA